ncbi:SpoIIE family protein phosphatase [Streptosporangium sp. NPDC023825]|uniref:SpoIIE family protein phosphatase n=1 Tax=Streptosporangium sp. NPDC023825 TaxID=3154909 RepID=UPI00341F4662
MEKLRALESMDDGLTATEALRAALHHAVAELGGLGGMAHLSDPSGDHALRLVVTTGLPRTFTQAWENVKRDEPGAPARAARGGAFAWSSPKPAAYPAPGSEPQSRTSLGVAGMAAVPLPGPDGPLGTLSVLTAAPGEPSPDQQAFLRMAARWAANHLRGVSPPPSAAARGVSPTLSGAQLQQALNTVMVGTWDWDIRTGDLTWSDALCEIFGVHPDTFDGQIETWTKMVHPEDLPWVLAALDEAIRSKSMFSAEHRICHTDGKIRWVQVRSRLLLDESGEPAYMIGTLWDTTEARFALDRVGRVLWHMSDGFIAMNDDGKITFLNLEAERLIGSGQKPLGRVLWDLPTVTTPDLEDRFRQATDKGMPAEFDVRWPANNRCYHVRLVPVPEGMTMFISDVTEKRAWEAEQAADARAAAERAARIGELTSALASALTLRDVMNVTADRLSSLFVATGLIIYGIENNRLRSIGSVGYSQACIDSVQSKDPATIPPIVQALESRAPVFICSPEEYLRVFPDMADLLAVSGKRAWAFLPLLAPDHRVGCCVLGFSQPRRFTEDESTLLNAVGSLMAHALERARLYEAEHAHAQELQRELLPHELPSLPAVTAAARYMPAGKETEVGGDWYDIIPLSSDRVALVIGDVMGHGMPEAVTMGRLRTAVHTLAALELPPEEILYNLNELVSNLGDDSYATCLYALYDPSTRICTLAGAGHPSPAIVRPDGTAFFPDIPANPPLGAAEPPFETLDVQLPDDALLVLYTDGLVESPTCDLDSGMAQLAASLTTSLRRITCYTCDAELELLCDSVTGALLPADLQTTDDAALLITRVKSFDRRDMSSWCLPEDPRAAGVARQHVREQLSTWGLDDLTMTTELLASELIGNVVRHAKGPIVLRLLRSRSLICEVHDRSLTTPRIRRASETDEGGRGLQLVAALSQRWGTRYTAEGKCIWTEQPLPARAPAPASTMSAVGSMTRLG